MIKLLPGLRDFINLKIEDNPELWSNLKKFKNTFIHIRFVDKPLRDYYLVFSIDGDGLLKSSSINNAKEFEHGNSPMESSAVDIVVSLDNAYFTNVGKEFVGWGFDFNKSDLPDANVFTSGLKIEGDASTIQELAPLLELILSDLSPLASYIKKSSVNMTIKNFFEYYLQKEKTFLIRGDFEDFVKNVRIFRNDIDRVKKKIEILGEKGQSVENL